MYFDDWDGNSEGSMIRYKTLLQLDRIIFKFFWAELKKH